MVLKDTSEMTICKHNEELEPLLNFTDLVIILDQVTQRVKVSLQREALMDSMCFPGQKLIWIKFVKQILPEYMKRHVLTLSYSMHLKKIS